MKKSQKNLRGLFYGIIFLLPILASCGTGSSDASPVASVPLPENDSVTISSPDANGLVTLTAVNDFVPASATVIVTVSSSTASRDESFPKILASLVMAAQASTCSSDLPVCPDLDDADSCQYTADENGAFTLQVPADTGDSIAISYLDPDTCSEVSIFEALSVTDDVVSIPVEANSLAFARAGQYAYVVGSDSEGHDALDVITLADHSVNEGVDFTDLGYVVTSLDYFIDTDDGYFLTLTGVGGTSILHLADSSPDFSTFSESQLQDVEDGNGNMEADVEFVGYAPRSYTGNENCGTSDGLTSSDSYMQLYFQKDGNLKIYEYQTSLTNAIMASESTSGGIVPIAFGLSTAGQYTIQDIAKVLLDGEHVFFVVQANTASENHYYVMRDTAQDVVSCTDSDSSNIDVPDDVLDLGTMSDGAASLVVGDTVSTLDSSGSDVDMLPIFMNGQTLVFVDLANFEVAATLDISDDLVSVTLQDSSYDVTTTASNVEKVYSFGLTDFGQTDGGMEALLLGNDGGGSDFVSLTEGQDSILEPTDSTILTISPRGMTYDSATTGQVLVLDAGNADDYTSNLIFYDLAL